MSRDDLSIIQSDAGLVADVRSMIAHTRDSVARTVNIGMTLLYWRIGKRIQTVLPTIKELTAELERRLIEHQQEGSDA